MAVLVLLLGLAAAVVFAKRQQDLNAQQMAAVSDRLAGQAASELQRRFRAYEYALRDTRDAMSRMGAGAITREDFQRYARSRDLANELPGAHGLGWIVRVPEQQEAQFSTAMLAQDPGFSVHPLARHPGERFVIKYLEPEAMSRELLGLDIASDTGVRETALAAMRSGKPMLSGPLSGPSSDSSPGQLALFLLPVYESARQPPSPAIASRNGTGWVCVALPMGDTLIAPMLAQDGYRLAFSDVTDRGNEQQPHLVALYGRQWRVDAIPGPDVATTQGLLEPQVLGLAIASIGLLMSLLAYSSSTGRPLRGGAYAKRARLAAIAESSPDAIVGTTLEGRVTEWNRAAAEMFGYTAEEAIGRSLVELTVPFEHVQEDSDILQRAARGQEVVVADTVRRHRDGAILHVELAASPIRGRGRRVLGIGFILRDIAERKEAQAEILQQNVSLELQVEERTAQIQAYTVLQHAILTHAGYAIIAADSHGIVTLFNPAAANMLGYAPAEVVGKVSPVIFHDPIEMAERAHALQGELGRRIEPGFDVFMAKARTEPDVHEWTFITKNGDRIPVLLTVTALRKADGELLGFLGIAADLRERKRREAALATNERKLRSLFELSPLGIVLTDAHGKFVEFNEAFRALTQYSEQELKAIDNWTLTPQEYESQERALLRQVQESGHYGPYEKHYTRKDGTRIPIRLNGVVLRINDRPHVWSLVEDITAQRASEAVMVDAVAAAEAASKAKSDFLANMSHEIRTPMNAILGMLQLLQKTGLDARQQDYAGKTETAARALLDILNDILDFSKIEAGRQTLESHEFELEQVLRDISVILSANIGDKDIELVFDVDKRVPPLVIGDSLRLQQVLINLVGNAIKFTEFGEVVLAVRLLNLTGEHATLSFEVRDTGIGIDKDKLAVIFDGFSQAEASTTRRFGGTGLGLAISQRLVHLMGGELGVESERGLGSRFFFTIALDVPKAGITAPAAAAPERLHDLRVLVVDDNDCARSAIAAMVQSIGWQVEEAANGEDALERVRRADAAAKPYEVIFLDWRMPGLDGWETGERIRRMHSDKTGDAPLIVMVTAHGRELLAERQVRNRPMLDGFLIKPVTVAMLIDAVADARAGQTPGEPAPATATGNIERLSGMKILAVDDNPTNQQLVAELLRSEGAYVEIAGGGAQAIRLLTEKEHFHVVLMDIQMPDMDGYATTRRIRANLGLDKIPIIAMTANVLPSDREACLAAGMNDHIGKPFDLDVLVQRLLHWTGRAVPERQHRPETPAPQASNNEVAILGWQAALGRFGGKRMVYAETLRGFPDAIQSLLQQLEQSLQQHQRENVARQLHTLKGIAAMVGAERLAQMSKSFETAVAKAQGEWEGALDMPTLLGCVDEAITASRELFSTLFTEGAPDKAQAEPVSQAALEELQALLTTSNLRALDEFRALETALSTHHSVEHRQIQGALARLDFAAAASVCRSLLSGQHSRGGDDDSRNRAG